MNIFDYVLNAPWGALVPRSWSSDDLQYKIDSENVKKYYREAPYDALPFHPGINDLIGGIYKKAFKADPSIPLVDPRAIPTDSKIPSHIPQDQVSVNSTLPSHIPQVDPRAELPYLIAEAEGSPYYKVDAHNRPVLRPNFSDDDIANNIIRGKYGNGDKRVQALTNLGLSMGDIKRIQGVVNARMYASRAAARPRVSTPVPTPQPQQRRYYQGMPMSGNWGVQDIM